MVKKWLPNAYLLGVFIFLYAPIIVLMVFSFNESRNPGVWTGFSLIWYEELFADRRIQEAFTYTLSIATVSTIISTIFGTVAALGIHKLRGKLKLYANNVNYFPVINPEIVTAIALLLLFRSIRMNFGLSTLLIAHVVFSTPYVILAVLPRIQAMNPNMVDAAMDLGATPLQAIRKVVLPEIKPSIFTGALMAFTMSFDDFVISFFTTGGGVTNLSIEVYAMARRGIRPTVNALATLMVTAVVVIILVANHISIRNKTKRLNFHSNEKE